MFELTVASDTNDECSLAKLRNTMVSGYVETVVYCISFQGEFSQNLVEELPSMGHE